RDHVGQGRAGQAYGSGEIDVERLDDRARLRFGEDARARDSGVVHEDLGRTVLRADRGDAGAHGFGIGDVELHPADRAVRREVSARRLHLGFVEVTDDHARPGPQELERDAAPYSAPAAGDERETMLQRPFQLAIVFHDADVASGEPQL